MKGEAKSLWRRQDLGEPNLGLLPAPIVSARGPTVIRNSGSIANGPPGTISRSLLYR
jgi:hypothetical protein